MKKILIWKKILVIIIQTDKKYKITQVHSPFIELSAYILKIYVIGSNGYRQMGVVLSAYF